MIGELVEDMEAQKLRSVMSNSNAHDKNNNIQWSLCVSVITLYRLIHSSALKVSYNDTI